jgi:predicted aconitase with swiveling domain
MSRSRQGHALVAGEASGPALVLDHGLSFAMGFDVETGVITDVHSSFTGVRLTGRILVMPSGRGSSSASTSFAEALRLGTGPAGIIVAEVDEILAIGSMVARTLYEVACPIVMAKRVDYEAIEPGAQIQIWSDGSFRIT